MSYTHFTLDERKYLQKLLSEGLSFRKIAEILERSPSTISREVKRNKAKYKPHRKTDNKYWYNHWRATFLYNQRRKNRKRNYHEDVFGRFDRHRRRSFKPKLNGTTH